MKSDNAVLQSCFKVVICNNKLRTLCNEYNIVVDNSLNSGQSAYKFIDVCKVG